MKATILILISGVLLFLSGCKKDNDTSNNSLSRSNLKITISDFQQINDGIKISWSKLKVSNFQGYYIIRRNYKATDTTLYNYYEIIESIPDFSTTTFTDVNVPTDSYLEYQVVGRFYDSISHVTQTIYSNVKSLERPEMRKFRFNPKDVLQDLANHRLYVIDNDSGKISILDYSSRKISHQIFTFATLGFSSLGTFNGKEELYVPRNDGWIYIYDANTLEKTDQIKTGIKCYSVIYNNGKLFVVADTSYYNYAMKVFDRAGKNLITFTGLTEGPEHLALVPGSNTKLFGIGDYNLFSFEYDANGHYISWSDVYSNLSNYTYRAFETFPNGQGLITSKTGSIYSNSLNLVQNLPYGDNEYSAFTFNSPLTSLFAGCSNYKHVVEYACPGYSELKTYPCNGYPAAVFFDAGNLIVLSSVYSSSWYSDPADYYLESIPVVTKK
ncbi:MAG: hypothetical protein Q8867_10105 [Bacteroidota bacterium]|nr:hypothetical protein [Bacteroidota bacterium]